MNFASDIFGSSNRGEIYTDTGRIMVVPRGRGLTSNAYSPDKLSTGKSVDIWNLLELGAVRQLPVHFLLTFQIKKLLLEVIS